MLPNTDISFTKLAAEYGYQTKDLKFSSFYPGNSFVPRSKDWWLNHFSTVQHGMSSNSSQGSISTSNFKNKRYYAANGYGRGIVRLSIQLPDLQTAQTISLFSSPQLNASETIIGQLSSLGYSVTNKPKSRVEVTVSVNNFVAGANPWQTPTRSLFSLDMNNWYLSFNDTGPPSKNGARVALVNEGLIAPVGGQGGAGGPAASPYNGASGAPGGAVITMNPLFDVNTLNDRPNASPNQSNKFTLKSPSQGYSDDYDPSIIFNADVYFINYGTVGIGAGGSGGDAGVGPVVNPPGIQPRPPKQGGPIPIPVPPSPAATGSPGAGGAPYTFISHPLADAFIYTTGSPVTPAAPGFYTRSTGTGGRAFRATLGMNHSDYIPFASPLSPTLDDLNFSTSNTWGNSITSSYAQGLGSNSVPVPGYYFGGGTAGGGALTPVHPFYAGLPQTARAIATPPFKRGGFSGYYTNTTAGTGNPTPFGSGGSGGSRGYIISANDTVLFLNYGTVIGHANNSYISVSTLW